MQVTPGGGYRGVSQGGLHQADRRSSVESVAGVSVSQPMTRDIFVDLGSLSRSSHDSPNLRWVEVPNLAARKNGSGIWSVISKRCNNCPHGGWQQNGSCLFAFAENADLAPIDSLLQIVPRQSTKFAHSQTRSVEQ